MMRAHDSAIAIGAHVKFDSEHGPQRGTVSAIKSDLGNGRRVAAVQVPGALDGQPWHIPVDQLKHAGAGA